jgi:hypothetical protein
MDLEWDFFPRGVNILIFRPVCAFRRQLEVEMEEHFSENESHFDICQAKRLKRVELVYR